MFSITGTSKRRARSSSDVLDQPDLGHAVEVLLERAQAVGRVVAHPEVAAVEVLVLIATHALDDERVARCRIAIMPGTRWTPSSTIDQPSVERAVDRRLDADEHVARLVEEAEQARVARLVLLGLRQRRAPPRSSSSAPTA